MHLKAYKYLFIPSLNSHQGLKKLIKKKKKKKIQYDIFQTKMFNFHYIYIYINKMQCNTLKSTAVIKKKLNKITFYYV